MLFPFYFRLAGAFIVGEMLRYDGEWRWCGVWVCARDQVRSIIKIIRIIMVLLNFVCICIDNVYCSNCDHFLFSFRRRWTHIWNVSGWLLLFTVEFTQATSTAGSCVCMRVISFSRIKTHTHTRTMSMSDNEECGSKHKQKENAKELAVINSFKF